jgi:formylmethanofuran dehydrogenase subunit B
MSAWIHGKPATLQAAAKEAARVLASARLPVIAGLGTDIAGARAVLALAARLGAAVDHMNSDALLRDLDIMRESGLLVTTANEARLRADVLLLIGGSLAAGWPDVAARLLRGAEANRLAPSPGRIVWMCPPRKAAVPAHRDTAIRTIGRDPAELPSLLALLRARVAGRPVAAAGKALAAIDAIAADLKAAKFGVAVWSAAELDALTIEMLCGLVDDLNAATRFTGLPLAPADNARGVLEACGWITGFPVRTGFGRGCPEHDPWRFDAARLIESGEGDSALWISAYRPAVPAWRRELPTVALTARGAPFRAPPQVLIEVGRPGIDHDAVEFRPESGTLMPISAMRPGPTLPVAQVIGEIAAALPERGAPPC